MHSAPVSGRHSPPTDALDGYVNARRLCALLDCSLRTLRIWIRAGKIPPPDWPAEKLGQGNRWLVSTVDRVLKEKLAEYEGNLPAHPSNPTGRNRP